MPKRYSSTEVVAGLERGGFVFVSQRGSHLKFRQTDRPARTVIVPANRKEIPRGTFASILRQSGLCEGDFGTRRPRD